MCLVSLRTTISTLIIIIALIAFKDVNGQGADCDESFLDKVIQDRLEKIPSLIKTAKEVVAEDLEARASRYHGHGVSLLTGVLLDIGSDWVAFNRSLGNLFGDSTDRFVGLHNHGNTFGSNVADGVSLLFGLSRAADLDTCSAFPVAFSAYVDQYNLQQPEVMTASDLLAFAKLIKAQMKCLLEYEKSNAEVADLSFAISELIKAVQIRFENC